MHTAFVMSLISLIKVTENWSLKAIEEGDIDRAIDLNVHFYTGSLLVGSRTDLVKQALEWGADWILWLDSDMQVSPDSLLRLLMREKDVVGCNYVRRQVPTLPVTTDLNDKLYCTNPEDTGLIEVKHTGFGCLLVNAKIYAEMEQPWFDTQWVIGKETGKILIMGEDVYFFRKVRDAGYKVWIDNDLSQSVIHIGTFEYHNRLARATVEDSRDRGVELDHVNCDHS
jgi:glycosyltransferase involved in cell wall biosynthesis